LRMESTVLPVTAYRVEFGEYELKFKALADRQRLQIMHELTNQGSVCVCDLTEIVEMTQSKLSYHLKILLDAGLILKETRGTWSYYQLNHDEVNRLLSPELCCIFRMVDVNPNGCCSDTNTRSDCCEPSEG
jgi:ArsR family transcriptional regulator, arsenate/arsenite/antimonite-responsive transcriptional repressor